MLDCNAPVYKTRLTALFTTCDFSENESAATRERCRAFLDDRALQHSPHLALLIEAMMCACDEGMAPLLPWLFYQNAPLPFKECLLQLQRTIPTDRLSLRGAVFPAHNLSHTFVFTHADFTHADMSQLQHIDQATYAFTFQQGTPAHYARFSAAQLRFIILTRFYRLFDEAPRPNIETLQRDTALQLLQHSCREAFLKDEAQMTLCDETVIFLRLSSLLLTPSPKHLVTLLEWSLKQNPRPSSLTALYQPLRISPSPLSATLYPYQHRATHAIDDWFHQQSQRQYFTALRVLYLAALFLAVCLSLSSGRFLGFGVLIAMVLSCLPLFGVSSASTATLGFQFAEGSLQLLATSYVTSGLLEQWGGKIPRGITPLPLFFAMHFLSLKIIKAAYDAAYLQQEKIAYSRNPALTSPQQIAKIAARKKATQTALYALLPYLSLVVTAGLYTHDSAVYRLLTHLPLTFRTSKGLLSLGLWRWYTHHAQQTDDILIKNLSKQKSLYWGIELLFSIVSLVALITYPNQSPRRLSPDDFYESSPVTLHPFSTWRLWLFSKTTPDAAYLNAPDPRFVSAFFKYQTNSTVPYSTSFAISQGFMGLIDTHASPRLAIADVPHSSCALLRPLPQHCPRDILSGMRILLLSAERATPLAHTENAAILQTEDGLPHLLLRVPDDAVNEAPRFATHTREWVDLTLFAVRASKVESQQAPRPNIPRRRR